MNEVAAFISQVGFPIFVACVLLYQTYNLDRENHRSIEELSRSIAELRDQVHGLVETVERLARSRS